MKTLKKISKVVLCVIMFISLFLGFSMLMVTSSMSDSSVLTVKIITPEFNESVYASIQKALTEELKGKSDVVSWDDISDVVTEQNIRKEIPAAMVSVTDRLFGKSSEVWMYSNDELKARIESLNHAYVDKYSPEYPSVVYDQKNVDDTYKLICETVTSKMGAIPKMYIDRFSPLVVKVIELCSLWYIPMIVYVLSAAGVMIIGRHHVKRSLYNLVLSSYFAMFAVFSISYILYKKDYIAVASRVFDDPNLQYLLGAIYRVVISDMRQIALVLSIMFLIMGIVISVVLAVKDEKRRYRRSVRRRLRHEEKQRTNEISTDAELGRKTLDIVNEIGKGEFEEDEISEIPDNFADLLSGDKTGKTE